MQARTHSQRFAEFILGLRHEDIPASALEATRRHFLDSVGVMVASDRAGAGTQGRELARAVLGKEEASAVGVSVRVPAVNAALANGMLAHALDFDDSHSGSVTHPSAVLVPAALAAAEMRGASARECLTAAVAGYEINARIGAVAGAEFMRRGFHTTALAGALAAAAVAGRLLGLDREQLVSAMGLAGSQASGLTEFLSDGTNAKQLHAGWAAHAGVVAAFLAGRGLTGPASVLEGPFGLYAAHLGAGAVSAEGMTEDLGRAWTTTAISYKAYPACHLTHSSVDALLAIMARERLVPSDLEHVLCRVPDYYVSRVLEPIEHKYRPRSAYEAKFSLPFCIASAAFQQTLTVDSFAPAALGAAEVLSLARRVSYEVIEFEEFPQHYPGHVVVTTRDGRSFEQWERHNRLLDDADLQAKFMRNLEGRMPVERARELARGLRSLGEAGSSQPLSELLEPLRFGGR